MPVLLALLLLAGCTPASYSSEAEKAVTSAHGADGLSWFAEHMPQAEPKKGRALAGSSDLFCAIEGEYQLDGETYRYIYDYDSDRMYLQQLFDQVTARAEAEYAALLDAAPQTLHFIWNPAPLVLTSADDRSPGPGETHYYEDVLDASVSEEVYVQDALYGGDYLTCDIFLTGAVPKENPVKALGLSCRLICTALMQYEGSGICGARFSRDSETFYNMQLQAAGGGYAGVVTEGPDPDPDYVLTEEDGMLTFTISERSRPVVFNSVEKDSKYTGIRRFAVAGSPREAELSPVSGTRWLSDEDTVCFDIATGYPGLLLPEKGLTCWPLFRTTQPAAGTYSVYFKAK